MHRNARKTLLNVATGVAVAATALVVFLPAAQAAPGVVTTNVNVRSGPGTNFGIVDQIVRGTQVDVQNCQGSWCYVVKPGPDGWVSSSYLSAAGGGGNSSGPGFSFGVEIGGDGRPNINFGIGNQPQRPPVIVRPPVRDAEVCFFDRNNYRGNSFCLEEGESARLSPSQIGVASIDNPDGARVEVCRTRDLRDCRVYTTSASRVGAFGDTVRAVRVR